MSNQHESTPVGINITPGLKYIYLCFVFTGIIPVLSELSAFKSILAHRILRDFSIFWQFEESVIWKPFEKSGLPF